MADRQNSEGIAGAAGTGGDHGPASSSRKEEPRLKAHKLRRITIVDSGKPHLGHLANALSGEGYLCQRFTQPGAFLRILPNHNCDLVVTDGVPPAGDTFELLSTVKKIRPELPVVVVTEKGSTALAVQAMKSGAADFIQYNEVDSSGVVSRISEIIGQSEVVDALIPSELTLMERIVLRHVLHGYGNKDIAQMLRLSVRTVEDHRRNMMRKLGMSNVVELVKHCVAKGIVRLTGAWTSRDHVAEAQPESTTDLP